MASVVRATNRWIKAAIDAGLSAAGYSTVKVFPDVADLDASYPCVVYIVESAPVALLVGASRGPSTVRYLVQAWARADATSPTTLTAIANAVESGITGAASSTIDNFLVTGGWITPVGEVDGRDFQGDVVYLRRGAHYAVFASPS